MLTALVAMLSVLIGRASLLGLTVPLSAAYFSAVRHHRHRLAGLAGLGIVLGSLTTGAIWTSIRLAVALATISACARWAGHRLHRASRWRHAALCGGFAAVAVLGTRLVGGLIAGFAPYDLAVGVAEAGLSFLAGVVLHGGASDLLGGGRVDFLRGEATMSLLVLLTGALAGMSGMRLAGFELTLAAGALVTMLLARAGGGALGALTGVSVGLIVAWGGDSTGSLIGAWAVAGMLAGIGGDFGTIGSVAGFAVGMCLLAAIITEPAYLGTALLQSTVAGAILLVIPARLIARARLIFRGPDASDEGAQINAALWLLAANRLAVLANVFSELAEAFEEPAAALSMAAVSASPGTARARSTAQTGAALAPAVEARRLLARQLAGVSGITADLAGRMSLGDIPAGLLRAREVEDALTEAGRRVKQAVLAPAEHGFEIHVQCQESGAEGCDWCSTAAIAAVRPAVGRNLHLARRQCALPTGGCYFSLATEPRLELQVGMARRIHNRELISGDSYVTRRVGGHRHLLLLCDGMGKGLAAARESVTAVRMVEAMLDAGFSLETTMHTINTALFLRSPQEAFTTIDLSLVDLADGRLDVVKIGACPSYIYRDGRLRLLEVKSPPLGILDSIHITGLSMLLRPGDVLVMVSDGLYGGRAGLPRRNDWLRRAIERHGSELGPQGLSDLLLASAVERQDRAPSDDMTVLVASLRKRGSSG